MIPFVSNYTADDVDAAVPEEKHVFRGVEFKCKREEEGPDATPQSPPLIIDDPGTPGCNRFEINVTFDGDYTKGEKHFEAPLLDLNYGIGDNVQLKFEVPELLDKAETAHSLVGDPKLGIKYMFFQDESREMQAAFYPQIETRTVKSERGSEITLPILFTEEIGKVERGPVVFNINIGYKFGNHRVERDRVAFATAVGVPLTHSIASMTEIVINDALNQFQDERREETIIVNTGLRLDLSSLFALYGSVGASLLTSDKKQHQYALAGIQIKP
ncbi:MAG: hypothetical protein H7249_17910 [Chitinophagaceae bacterium]|nr:hypothetical protein [Oligoflexus sp.]